MHDFTEILFDEVSKSFTVKNYVQKNSQAKSCCAMFSVKDLNYFMNKIICFNDIMKTLKLNVTV